MERWSLARSGVALGITLATVWSVAAGAAETTSFLRDAAQRGLRQSSVPATAPRADRGGTAGVATERVLYSFTGGFDGEFPGADLVADATGNLYGETYFGGTYGRGELFKLSPPAAGGGWTLSVLYSFSGANGDGAAPDGDLILRNGAIFGTTSGGGNAACSNGCGTVFEVSPPAAPNGSWSESVVYAFSGADPGDQAPTGALAFDANGGLVGLTSGGRTSHGTAFRLVPPAPGAHGWTHELLHIFAGKTVGDGSVPDATIAADGVGDIFGATSRGGRYDYGTIFELSPPAAGTTGWKETILHHVNGTSDGAEPNGGVTWSGTGLFGTTLEGGIGCGVLACGVVFEMMPVGPGLAHWTGGVLHYFDDINGNTGNDGATSYGGVAAIAANALYGFTSSGGIHERGVAFRLTPPSPGRKGWTETILHAFGKTGDGAFPLGRPVVSGGTVFGTSLEGGAFNRGAVFAITP